MRHDKEMTRRHVVKGFYTLIAEFEIDETHEVKYSVPVTWTVFAVRLVRNRPNDRPKAVLQLTHLTVRSVGLAVDGVQLLSDVLGQTLDVAHRRELTVLLLLAMLHSPTLS